MQKRRLTICLCLLALTSPCVASAYDEPQLVDPLFTSHEVLAIRLTGPFTTIMRERSDEEELPGTASWTEPDGRRVEVPVELRARGNYRRRDDVCRFPPIRLDFPKSEVEDTLFDEQDKLKLVTHCDSRGSRHKDIMMREYTSYRMMNVLTDLSYRVRILRLTYVDTEDDNEESTEFAIAIEHKDRFAERTGWPVVEIPGVPGTSTDMLNGAQTNLTSVFAYMIGNTDFSPIAGPRDAECCHNSHLFGDPDDLMVPVLYDFDMSGMVDAYYATPNPRFGLRNVRQRLYRGRCVNNDRLDETIRHFIEKKPALYALLDEHADILSRNSRRGMESFLDSFYRDIEDPRRVQSRLMDRCIGPDPDDSD